MKNIAFICIWLAGVFAYIAMMWCVSYFIIAIAWPWVLNVLRANGVKGI